MTPVKTHMDQEMELVFQKLTELTDRVDLSIKEAIASVKNKDTELARRIIDNDEAIDVLEEEIGDKCIRILATQQPLAGDLRKVVSIMKMIKDLERIGDHCEDIAKYTLRLENEDYFKELVDIPRMADYAARMVRNAIDAFINMDLRLARKVWKADEEVDEIFRDIYAELLAFIDEDASKAKQSVMFLFIASHLERIADYATNICEETVFAMEGTHDMEK